MDRNTFGNVVDAKIPVAHREDRLVGRARPARPDRLRQPAGADAVLVGESLVTGEGPEVAAVADLVVAGAHPALRNNGRG